MVFLAVLILDVDIGVGIGVAYAIMTVMFRLQKPKVRGLGRMPGTDLYKPIDVYTTVNDTFTHPSPVFEFGKNICKNDT